ncbi:hypothetical protein NPIL_39991 [Nephila pilipes]|uniref:Uncharacterized protein n=1 Tax=Nephila pilipes TaxID=299642 RepID=A0A8X6U767_NEPPI|nr:hypothetical protein NPIL_39991 [Nephila pilipes]
MPVSEDKRTILELPRDILLKAYFTVLVAMCVVVLTLQSVEMSPDANEKNQSDNLITLELSRHILGDSDILPSCSLKKSKVSSTLFCSIGYSTEVIMKSCFLLILSVCIVLLSLYPGVIEMAPKARVERQSGDDNLLTIGISRDTVVELLQALLGDRGLLGGLLG